MMPVTLAQLRATATVDLMTAAAALGLGRTKAYELARRGQFPCRVIRIGEVYRIPTPGLLELLGVAAEEPRSPTPPTAADPAMPAHLTWAATARKDPAMPLPRQPDRNSDDAPGPNALPDWVPRQGRQRAELVIWGAHGGGGHQHPGDLAAACLGHGRDAARSPTRPTPRQSAIGRALIMACRATAWSAGQATKAVAAVNRQGGQVAVLAVVSDGWPEPASGSQPVPAARAAGRGGGPGPVHPGSAAGRRPGHGAAATPGAAVRWPRSRPPPAGPLPAHDTSRRLTMMLTRCPRPSRRRLPGHRRAPRRGGG